MSDLRFLLLGLTLLVGCAPEGPGPAAGPAPRGDDAPQDDAAWAAELSEHRARIHHKFTSYGPSPIAATQRLTAESVSRVYLTRQDRSFAFEDSAGPATELSLIKAGPSWTWEKLGDEVSCEAEGEPSASGSAISGDINFDIVGIHLGCFLGEDRINCIVYDPERPEKRAFEGLLFYPPDRGLAVPATLVRIAEPDEVEMITSLGLKSTFLRYALLRFELDGSKHQLAAFKSTFAGEWSNTLFVPFRDLTSGEETYGAGRYLDLVEPEGEALTLDFNRAYNPLCNYSPAFNCPIPPRENRLDVAIRAGERTYSY